MNLIRMMLTLVAFAIKAQVSSGLSCQGLTYAEALQNCPDQGALFRSNGGSKDPGYSSTQHYFLGNVSLTVMNITNLPSSRVTLGSSNPYLRVLCNGNTFTSSVRVGNYLPSWENEPISTGYVASASDLSIQVWYSQPGFDFLDRMVEEVHIRVPYCNSLSAYYHTETCPEPFYGCSSDSSSWSMPTEPLCVESSSISMTTGQPCTSTVDVCISLAISITPFAIRILESHMNTTPTFTGVAYPVNALNFTQRFGYPYEDSNVALDLHITESSVLLGALMIQMPNAYRSYGTIDTVLFYAAINFPAILYICRDSADNQQGVPPWIANTFANQNQTATRLLLQDGITSYNCFYKYESATVMNKFGYVVSDPIAFYSNAISATNAVNIYYRDQYIVILTPLIPSSYLHNDAISYIFLPFFISLVTYGIIWLWFTFVIYRFLQRINFRLDRIENHIRILGFNKSQLNVFNTLLYHHSMEPLRMKSNLFYGAVTIKLILCLPLLALVPWSIHCYYQVSPSGIGSMVLFAGATALLLCFGQLSWKHQSWRLSFYTLIAFVGACVSSLCFALSVIFRTSAEESSSVSFPALSLAFSVVNAGFYFPCLLISDKGREHRHQEVSRTLTALITSSDEPAMHELNDPEMFLRLILGWFTIDTSKSTFRFSTTLFDPRLSTSAMYILSAAVLVPYIVVTGLFTPSLSLGLMNSATILVLDFAQRCFSHPSVEIPLRYQVVIITVGRLLIMGSSPETWMVLYSAVYALYASVIYLSILHRHLPSISSKTSSKELFALLVPKYRLRAERDVSRNPIVSCVVLLVCFIWVQLLTSIGTGSASLPVLHYQYAISTLAIMLPIMLTALTATTRIFYLQSFSLLSKDFKKAYVVFKACSTPIALCTMTEIFILSTGVIMNGLLDW